MVSSQSSCSITSNFFLTITCLQLSDDCTNTTHASYHIIDRSLLLSKISEHLQEISGFAEQQGRHRNQHFHSRWACLVSIVQGIKIIALEHQ